MPHGSPKAFPPNDPAENAVLEASLLWHPFESIDRVALSQRRTIMNLVLLGGAGVPVLWLGGGFVYFFVPPSAGGGGGGLTAKDALGDDVKVADWAKAHPFPERSLVQGLKVCSCTLAYSWLILPCRACHGVSR